MTHPNFPTDISKQERDELIDFSVRIGQHCWYAYCRTKTGFVRLFLLPTDTALRRANELFQLGFSGRMLMCPPDACDTDGSLGDTLWQNYLGSQKGKVVLDGTAYPATPEAVLDYAKEFFLEGVRAGSIAISEIFKP